MNGRTLVALFVLICVIIESQGSVRRKRIVGGIHAAAPPEDDPVVFVNKNGRSARIFGARDPDKGFYTFRGIRFAEPPVARFRFQRPKAVHLEGDINATTWGSPCPQPSSDGSNKIIGSEDCLFLNVFTPSLPDYGNGYPVLIWIHGGGFRRGAACQYEMRNLIKKRLIVVSIQYRLGSLGFLSTGSKELPGNNGMFDMVSAINWVKDYIKFFGGNPNNIVAFGHGTGASSAIILSLSKISRSYFSGLIAMSGSVLSHFALDKDPFGTARRIALTNGCPSNDITEMVRCLQELPVVRLIQTDSELENIQISLQGFISGVSNLLGAGPVIEGGDDGRSLPNLMTETPENFLKTGDIPVIPLLMGVMKDEVGGALFGDYKNEVENKLRTVKNFFSTDLIPKMQQTIPDFSNGSQFRPDAFDNYLNILKRESRSDNVGTVAQIMDDSVFNAPAFLTVDHWAKRSKAFLYSFDHDGERNYGKDFLGGLPIVSARHSVRGITSHGDDLGYVFGRNTITGQKIKDEERINMMDERVTEVFTDMIADFARSGQLNIAGRSNNGSWFPSVVPTFSDDTNSFISITPAPRTMKNFKYCEMALWTGLVKRLQSTTCTLFKSVIQMVDKVGKNVEQTANLTLGIAQAPTKIVPIPNLPTPFAKGIFQNGVKEKDKILPLPRIPGIPFKG